MLMNTACSFCTRAVFQNKPLLGIFHVNLIIRMKLSRFRTLYSNTTIFS